jgi:6,7-dimethyl-8-ribityllumazine synthase
MATPDYRLFSLEEYPIEAIEKLTIGIIRTEWNEDIVSRLEESCKSALLELGITTDHILSYTVPGSYELPMGAKLMLNSIHKPDAVICLGCVIQGATKHDDYINHTTARAISQIGLISNKPVIFGVLTTNTKEQALERAGGSHGDKGLESAHAALKMISLKEQLNNQGTKISF